MAKRHHEHNFLEFTREWPFGLYAHNRSPESRLLSAYSRIASIGAPTGSINYLFLNAEEPLPRESEKGFGLAQWWDEVAPWRRRRPYSRTLMRLLGVLCYTSGGMLLYFPGYRGTWISGYDRALNPADRRDPFEVDHFTLEADFQRWHITARDGQRVRRLSVDSFAPDLIFWFAMTVHRASEFEAIYRRNTWFFDCPGSDAKRRLEDIVESEHGVEFQVVERPDAARTIPCQAGDVSHLWHFQFLVKLGSANDLPAPRLILPSAPLASIEKLTQIPVRRRAINLRGFNGSIVVDAARLSGNLSVPVLLTHP